MRKADGRLFCYTCNLQNLEQKLGEEYFCNQPFSELEFFFSLTHWMFMTILFGLLDYPIQKYYAFYRVNPFETDVCVFAPFSPLLLIFNTTEHHFELK